MVDTGLQPVAIGISIASPCVAFVFVLLRLYSRYFITRTLGWDDSLIIVPMILSVAQAYTTVMGIKVNYLGYHNADIPWEEWDMTLGTKYNYATQLLYNPILALVKNGMLLFFLRVGGTIDRLRWFIIALIIFNTTQMVAVFLTDMLQCIPIRKVFYSETEGECINTVAFFVATAALTILTDILVMIIPTWMTWHLTLKLRKKLAVIFLLSMGLLVTGISIYRMYYLISAYFGPPDADSSYSVGGTASSIEVNLAIAAACGPFLKPLVVKYFPRFFGRSTDHQYYYEYNDAQASDVLGYYRGPGASAYSAQASAARHNSRSVSAPRGGKALDAGFELQIPAGSSRRSLRRGNTTQSSSVGDEEDDTSQRGMVTPLDTLNMNQGLQHGEAGSDQSQQGKDGILRETSVNISYSPKDREEILRP